MTSEIGHVHPNRDGDTTVRPWEPGDGDLRCQSCGRPNVVWYTDHDLWNRVMPDDGVLCIACFIERAERIAGTAAWAVFVDPAPFRTEFARGFEAGRSTTSKVSNEPERERIAKLCRAWAVERFSAHGPDDARGAALWDVAAWLLEGDLAMRPEHRAVSDGP